MVRDHEDRSSRTWLSAWVGRGTAPAIPTIRIASTRGEVREQEVARAAARLLPMPAHTSATACIPLPFAGSCPIQYSRPAPLAGDGVLDGASSIAFIAASSTGRAVMDAHRGALSQVSGS